MNSTCVAVNGHSQVEWISTLFGECVRTPREQLAFTFGLIAILAWILANIPQLYENYMKKSAQGLSKYMLALWTSGDSANLIGTILVEAFITQILVAAYYILSDVILIVQYLYYDNSSSNKKYMSGSSSSKESNLLPEFDEDPNVNEGTANSSLKLRSLLLFSMFILVPFFMYMSSETHEQQNLVTLRMFHPSGRRLLSESSESEERYTFPPTGVRKISGYVIGYISAVLYLASRCPQIILNCSRGGTTGMSPLLFTLTCLANVSYSLSIFLYSTHRNYLLLQLPWLIGSLGVLLLDMFILIQALWFYSREKLKAGKFSTVDSSYRKLISEDDYYDDEDENSYTVTQNHDEL